MKRVSVFFVAMSCYGLSAGQGCSDAGFCTAGAMKAQQGGNPERTGVGLSLSFGIGEKNTSVFTPQLEWQQRMGKQGLLELKLPLNITSGKTGSHTGPGDPIITYTYGFPAWKYIVLKSTIGARIGTGRADAKTEGGSPLAMPYQSSLGTTDLILGLSAGWKGHLSLAAGYQQPLLQYNRNGYLPSMIEAPGPDEYFASRELERRADVLLRAEGHIRWRSVGISAGPLLIYHTGEDKVRLPDGERLQLDGSKGTTLNITGNAFYEGSGWRVTLAGGTPLIVRSYRTDGLTREFVITARIICFLGKKN